MEGDGEPALVRVLNGPGRADDTRAAWDQDPLAVGRIEWDRDQWRAPARGNRPRAA